VPDSGLQSNAAAHGVAHDVGFFETEVLDQGGDVVRHRLEAQRAVDVGRAPMGLQIGGDDLPPFCEQRENFAEHLDRADAAMQQDQRFPGAVDLVVHLETVHLGVVTFGAIVHPVSILVNESPATRS